MRLSTWIVLLVWLASLVLALVTGRDLLYNTFYFITLMVAGSWLWARLNLRGLAIMRRVRTPRSQVGKYVEEQFEITHRGWLTKLWVEILDDSDLPGHQASRIIVSLKRNKPYAWQVRTPCLRRGRFRLGPIRLRSGDPLGLFEVERVIPQTHPILIYPATFPIPGFHLPPGQLPGGQASHYRTQYLTTNVSTVREYVPGDSFNRIHWRSTARTGRLMVKEFELDPTSDVWILLDLDGRWHTASPWQMPEPSPHLLNVPHPLVPATIEYAAAVAASIAQRYLVERRAVGLITYTPHREILQLDRGHRQFTKILETLALVEPAITPSLAQILLAERHFLNRTTTLVVITPSAEQTWVAALRDYRMGGIHAAAVLIDASTFGPLPDSRDTLSQLLTSQIPTYIVRNGASISTSLTHQALLETL